MWKNCLKSYTENTVRTRSGHHRLSRVEANCLQDTNALRISPNELHLNDVNLYKTIYNQTATYVKDPVFYGGFGTPHTVFAEDDPALHKERRRLLNPFFSRSAIFKIESLLKEKCAEMGARIDGQPGPYNMYNAVRCMTVDIISHYCMGRPLGQVKKSDGNFYGGFLNAFDAVADVLWSMIYQPTLRRVLNWIPKPVAVAMSKEVAALIGLAEECFSYAKAYKSKAPQSDYPIIFSALTHLSDEATSAEAVDLLVAGSDTTAFSLTVAIANLSQRPDTRDTLVAALRSRIANPEHLPSLPELESIDILNACVREAIRFASPVPGRLPRVVPTNTSTPLIVDGQVVPPGTIVGMSAYTMHRSPELWGKDATEFNPDRWLGEKGKSLDQHMVSFSKGLRSCIGQNLAYAELHIVLAYLFRKYEISLAGDKANTQTAVDRFTYLIPQHGLPVNLKLRKD